MEVSCPDLYSCCYLIRPGPEKHGRVLHPSVRHCRHLQEINGGFVALAYFVGTMSDYWALLLAKLPFGRVLSALANVYTLDCDDCKIIMAIAFIGTFGTIVLT